MNLNKLPGNRGSFTAKTEKKTKMFVYQVNGTEADIQAFKDAKSAEGFDAKIDEEFGLLHFTSRNLGKQGILDVTKEGKLFAYNQGIRDAEELRGVVSDAKVDDMIIAAMVEGSYAKPVTVVVPEA